MHHKLKPEQLAAKALEAIENGAQGFTFDAYGNTPTTGYAVSVPQHERVHNLTTVRETFSLEALLIAEAPLWLPSYTETGKLFTAHWGGWIDGDLLYLDQSLVVNELQTAKLLGKKNKQLAIFDFASFETIRLDS